MPGAVYLTSFAVIAFSRNTTILFFEGSRRACKPKIVRVHTFWEVVFLCWSNAISTFFILSIDQGAHFVAVHVFGSIFGESFF